MSPAPPDCHRFNHYDTLMSLRLRLIAMNFLQFFVWGSWLLTIGAYWFQTKQWSGAQFGAIFSTMGIASLFMPSLMGVSRTNGYVPRSFTA